MLAWVSLRCSCHHQNVCIHPFIDLHVSGVRSHWPQAKQDMPDIPPLRNILQLLLGDPKAIHVQMRYVISAASAGSIPGSPPRTMCQEDFQRRSTPETSSSNPQTTSTEHPDPSDWSQGLKYLYIFILLSVPLYCHCHGDSSACSSGW